MIFFATAVMPVESQGAFLTITQQELMVSASANNNGCLQSQTTIGSATPVSVSLNCTIDLSKFTASSTASPSGLTGTGSINSLVNHIADYGFSVQVSGLFSEMLTFSGGPGSSAFVGIPVSASFDGAADSGYTTIMLGSQTASGCGGVFTGYCGGPPLGWYGTADLLVSPITYNAPITFSVQGSSGGSMGGNSNDEAGYSVSVLGQPILFATLPAGISVGNNVLFPGTALYSLVTPIGAGSGFSDDTPVPEPNALLLVFAGLAVLAVRRYSAAVDDSLPA